MKSALPISVCVPAYNGAAFIGDTIQSVLNQSFVDFELIISDDCSSDATVSIVKGFQDPRIRLVENPKNLGLGGNWNQILSRSVGKYVKLLCEDDLLHPECLARQFAILEHPANRKVVLTFCGRDVINECAQTILKPRRPRQTGIVIGSDLIRRSVRTGTNLIGEPAVGLFRREAMRKQEMCDPGNAFLSDLSLWAELLKWGDAFVDADCLASFRISRQAASSIIGFRQPACFRAFALKQREEGVHHIGRLDVISGCSLSVAWCFLRNALLRVKSRKCTATLARTTTVGSLSQTNPACPHVQKPCCPT